MGFCVQTQLKREIKVFVSDWLSSEVISKTSNTQIWVKLSLIIENFKKTNTRQVYLCYFLKS